jgi:hypothetical protein
VTRATLLHVLDRPTALGPAEVRELEQLAQAFPYCQTAHLLLAKAAHDQGTMLAGQRLRRAATYAADRTLLRRLIEMVEPARVPELESEPAALPTAVQPAAVEIPTTTAVPAQPEPIAPATPILGAAAEPVLAVTPTLEVPAIGLAPIVEAAPAPAAEVIAVAPAIEAVPAVEAPAAVIPTPTDSVSVNTTQEIAPAELPLELPPAEPIVAIDQAPEATLEATAAEVLPLPTVQEEPVITATPEPSTAPVAPQPEPIALPALVDQEGVNIPASIPVVEAEENIVVPEPAVEEVDLPAQAPAIRPPVEVGEARFEFGLAEPPLPVVPAYELPGLVDEWAAAAVTLSLGSAEAMLPETTELSAPAFTPAAFTGDAAVGYAFGESSRLGLSMQLLDMLAAQAEAAEAATAVVAAAQPPAAALPPTGTFFEPDPLLLDHWATHRPPTPALPSSLDLINNFLKRQPRLTRPAMLPPTAGSQTDLSARSTNAAPDLVSENLARIFVRQGKIARAVEIYEKLMVKHPEKMAYFAAQIQSLQPSA